MRLALAGAAHRADPTWSRHEAVRTVEATPTAAPAQPGKRIELTPGRWRGILLRSGRARDPARDPRRVLTRHNLATSLAERVHLVIAVGMKLVVISAGSTSRSILWICPSHNVTSSRQKVNTNTFQRLSQSLWKGLRMILDILNTFVL